MPGTAGPDPEAAMLATSLIQTAHPARFAGLVLASGIGLSAFAPAVPVPVRPTFRIVENDAPRRDAA